MGRGGGVFIICNVTLRQKIDAKEYELKDTYNADKFGWLYEYFPNKIYQLKSEKCSIGKLSKKRITDYHKHLCLRLGRPKSHHIWRNFLPCHYRNQPASFMDWVLLEEWGKEINKEFYSEGRKTALLINNFPAHPQIENLKSIKLFIFHRAQLLRLSQWARVWFV